MVGYFWLLLSILSPFSLGTYSPGNTSSCRCAPNESCWPNSDEWHKLNATTTGHLIKTLPVGHVCHDPSYDATQCKIVQEKWSDPFWRTGVPENVFETSFTNDACDPMAPRAAPCDIGGLAQYSINVSAPSDVSTGLRFAREHNLRLVVKNTGHE